ncbi:MAG: hypothetical protein O2794_04010 [bacterium]|nr:hypothetical protein [bacterium]
MNKVLKEVFVWFVILWGAAIATFIFTFLSEPVLGIDYSNQTGTIFFVVVSILARIAFGIFTSYQKGSNSVG